MKPFTSHSNTPTTIRANKICMKGILFFLSVLVARHFQQGPHFQPAVRFKLSFDILDACVGRGEQALGTGCSTEQSIYNIILLGLFCVRVCSLVYEVRRSLPPPLLPSNCPSGLIDRTFSGSRWRAGSARCRQCYHRDGSWIYVRLFT